MESKSFYITDYFICTSKKPNQIQLCTIYYWYRIEFRNFYFLHNLQYSSTIKQFQIECKQDRDSTYIVCKSLMRGRTKCNFPNCTLHNFSMTSLLTHTVAHSTRPSFRPKNNKQPLKKVLKSCGQLSKSCQKLQNSDFQSQFPMSKITRIFLNLFFIEEYHFRGTFFVIDIS